MASDPVLVVRAAAADDAVEAAALLRASISELCVLDHRNDPEALEPWLSNKTPGHFLRWLADPSNYLVIASAGDEPCGVGGIHERGEIWLCYVRVGWQRRGVGRALIAALEARARAWSLTELRLSSSLGARSFYELQGYRAAGEPHPGFGVQRAYPYVKSLQA